MLDPERRLGGSPAPVSQESEQLQAILTCSCYDGPGSIYCCHNDQSVFSEIETRIHGAFYLADCDQPEHEFVTGDGLWEFEDGLVEACRRAPETNNRTFQWTEEWLLLRDDDEGDPAGVWVVAATEARHVLGSVGECLDAVISNALRKFSVQRWANLHVLAMDRDDAIMTTDKVQLVLSDVEPSDLAVMDVLLMMDSNTVSPVWIKSDGPCGRN